MEGISHRMILNLINKVVRTIMGGAFRLLKKDYSESVHEGLMQFVKFGIVGVSNTVISYLLYSIVLLVLKAADLLPNFDYLVATVVAFVLSVLWSFYWNNKYVFAMKEGQSRNIWKALVKTYVSYSFTGLFLNSILMVLWVRVFGISEFIAPIINLLVSVPLNFVINKFWAFKAR